MNQVLFGITVPTGVIVTIVLLIIDALQADSTPEHAIAFILLAGIFLGIGLTAAACSGLDGSKWHYMGSNSETMRDFYWYRRVERAKNRLERKEKDRRARLEEADLLARADAMSYQAPGGEVSVVGEDYEVI